MSYADFIDEIKSALDGLAALTYSQQPRLSSVASRSSFNFDGAFALHNETGAEPWPELSLNPQHWKATLLVEVGVQVRKDILEDEKRLEQYARQVTETLMYRSTPFTHGCVYQMGTFGKQRVNNDGRIIWAGRYQIRWTE